MNAPTDIRVTISVHARYLAFHLAKGLQDHNLLDAIYTIYPKFKLSSYHLRGDVIKSFPWFGALRYITHRFGITRFDDALADAFSFSVAAALRKPDRGRWIFHALSGYAERPMLKAQRMGAIGVIERGCPHIDVQRELIAEEQSRLLKVKIPPHYKYVYDRMKREYDAADYIAVPSRYSQRSFIEKGVDPKKVLVVPICREKNVAPPQIPKKLDHFTVLCTGGNFYRKGLFYLLEAWRKLDLKDAELIFKGNVPKEFEYLLSGKTITRITRHLSDGEMAELYTKAHVFALPSIDEGFGMVVAEAMAAGLPVIVSENVGAADGIENGTEGFVVPIRSSDALAEKIKFFYDHPDRISEMSDASLKKSVLYAPEVFTERMIAAYRAMTV